MKQNTEKITNMSKAAASALMNTFTGLIPTGHITGSGNTKPIGDNVTSIYSSFFSFRGFVDSEARAMCSAFSAPMTASALLHGNSLLGYGISSDEVLRQLRLKDTADMVKRAFGPKQKEEGRVVSAPGQEPKDDVKPEEATSETEKKTEEVKEQPKKEEEQPQPNKVEEESLVPELDFAELVQNLDVVLPKLRTNIKDATNAIREAKLTEKSEEYEKKRVEMIAVFQEERDRLDAALKAACDEVDREAEESAAALKSKYEERVKKAEKKVEAADKAILEDANANPLKDEQQQHEEKEEPKQPEEKKEEEQKQPEEKKEEESKKPDENKEEQKKPEEKKEEAK